MQVMIIVVSLIIILTMVLSSIRMF